MKQSKRGRQALGLSALLHVLLLTGIAWLLPFAPSQQPIASLELDLITTNLTQAGPPLPSPVIEELPPKPDNTVADEPAITRFLDNQVVGLLSSEIAMIGTTTGNDKTFAGPIPANAPDGGVSPAAAQISAVAFRPPQLLHKVEPTYSEEARRQKLEGRVIISLEVLANGLAGIITIRQSSGQQLLDDAAIEAIRQWRFIPAKDARGMPVLSVTTVPVVFRLN